MYERLTPAVVAGFSIRIEDALVSKQRAQLEQLHADLVVVVRKFASQLPPAVLSELRDDNSSSEFRGVYELGQASFAQTIVAHATSKRSHDSFSDELHGKYRRYVEALSHKELTGVQLAEMTGEAVETVSRKLKYLREVGISEWRREGQTVLNFLTPAAIAAFSPDDVLPRELALAIMGKRDELPSHLRNATNFSHSH